MAEIGRFFDQVSYSEADQAELQARQWRDGIVLGSGYGNQLAVSVSGGFANVDTGEAFVQGFWYKNDAMKPVAIPTNATGTPRVDAVVLRLDRVLNTLTAVLHQGVVGSGIPALTQVAGGVWELALASVSTVSGVSTLLNDLRSYQSNMFNPMTTAGDIIVADVKGNPARLGKGAAGTLFGTDVAGNQGMLGVPQVSGAYNGNFEEGQVAGLNLTTSYAIVAPGWSARLTSASDTVAVTRVVPGVDALLGGKAALTFNKTGANGKADMVQPMISRMVGAYANRTATIVARIWSNTNSFIRCQYNEGGAVTYGAFNTTVSSFETITLTVNVGPLGATNAGVLQFGIDLAALAGVVYVLSCDIVLGGVAPVLVSPRPPLAALNAAAPKCMKGFGLNNNFTVAGGAVANTLPFTVAELDLDLMASGNGITIRTPGRYFVSCNVLVYTSTVVGYYLRLYINRNGGSLNPSSVYATQQSGMHINGTQYPCLQITSVDDFVIGDLLQAGASWDAAAGQTLGIYFNVTQFLAVRIGD